MLAISELTLVSRVPAVAIPPLVVAQAALVDAVTTDTIRVRAPSHAMFRNHSPAGEQEIIQQTSEAQKAPARHIDRFF